MTRQLEYATPGVVPPRRVRFLRTFAIVLPAIIFLTMGMWSRGTHEWAAHRRFDVEATRIVVGYPPWLIHNRVRSTGSPPTWASLPEGANHAPGWHIDLAALCLSLLICLLASVVVAAIAWSLRMRHPEPVDRYVAFVIVTTSAALGFFFNRDHSGLGLLPILSALMALPVIIGISASLVRGYTMAIALALASGLAYWWAGRMAQLRLPFSNGLMSEDEVSLCCARFAVLLVVAFASSFISGRGRAGRPSL